jgi:hypothetical protein
VATEAALAAARAAVDALPPAAAPVLVLTDVERWPVRQVGEALGLDRPTGLALLREARGAVWSALEDELAVGVSPPIDPAAGMVCRAVVEAASDYVESAVGPAVRTGVEAHLRSCEGCRMYLVQLRQTVEVLGRLPPDPVGEADLAALVAELSGAS